MPGISYRTISEELIEHAEVFRKAFKHRGYSVGIEPSILGAPATPTLRCTRSPTTMYIDVVARIDKTRALSWWQFCSSCSTDTRYAVAYVESVKPLGIPRTSLEQVLTKLRIGLWILRADGSLVERIAPHDLALGVELPALRTMPTKLRKSLATAYEAFEDSDWRGGFRESCDVIEKEARSYLWRGIRQERIHLVSDAGTPRSMTAGQVDRLTLGGLVKAFAQIRAPNQRDALIGKTLASINPDRILATHKGKRGAEKRLRTNVGRQMHVIIQGLRELLS